jgi:hypothetical protein
MALKQSFNRNWVDVFLVPFLLAGFNLFLGRVRKHTLNDSSVIAAVLGLPSQPHWAFFCANTKSD